MIEWKPALSNAKWKADRLYNSLSGYYAKQDAFELPFVFLPNQSIK